jgi:hypothetical protein
MQQSSLYVLVENLSGLRSPNFLSHFQLSATAQTGVRIELRSEIETLLAVHKADA